MAKILLIDDDEDLSSTIVLSLKAENHTVDAVYRGDDGLTMLSMFKYDVIILDVLMPGLSGIEVLKRYRQEKGTTPVIMLTGKSHINDREEGLDSGADDYLTKPFSVRELSARIRALMRRPAQLSTTSLQYQDVVLDPAQVAVKKNGVEIKLQPRDFALLEFFMRNPGQVFSIDALLSRVWNYEAEATPAGLRTAISRLRKALDPDDTEKSIIENVPKVGYRLGGAQSMAKLVPDS